MNNLTMNKKEWLLLFLLSLFWGGSFFFNELALVELQPFAVVLGRTTVGAAMLLAIVYASGLQMPSSPRIWGSFAVMALINNLVPFSLIVWGQQTIDSGLASILNATTPLFTVILAHFLTGEERLTPGRVIGIFLGLLGVVVLVGPDALSGIKSEWVAQLAVLGASCSYALAGIYGRRFRKMASMVPAAGSLTAAAVMTCPLLLLSGQVPPALPGLRTGAALLGLALFGTTLAYLVYFRLLATVGATNVLLVTFLIPVSALLLGVMVLAEPMEWTLLAGMVLVFAGLAAVDGRLLRSFFEQT